MTTSKLPMWQQQGEILKLKINNQPVATASHSAGKPAIRTRDGICTTAHWQCHCGSSCCPMRKNGAIF